MSDYCKISLVFFCFVFLPLFACTTSSNNGVHSSNLWSQEDNTPKNVIILPFENNTTEKDIEKLVRESFYNHFSSKNYHDIELSEIDRAIDILQHRSSKTWRDLSPSNLGILFHADYVIYGRVLEYDKYFLGIYSQIALKVEVEMVECKSGDGFWRKTIMKRSHEGGVPFDFFGIIPAAIRSGFHMQYARTVDLIERINRELVKEIPDPPNPPTLPFFVEVQVASFLDKERALKTLKELEEKGYNPRIEEVTLGDHNWKRIILGPYYQVSDAEKVRDEVHKNSPFQPIFIHHYPGK